MIMVKKMLIESVPRQTRIVTLEEDRAVELYLERERAQGLVGNVYKGVVHRVLPGMQAAFVDIGLERDAFLILTHAEVKGYMQRKAADYDRWIGGMNKLLRRLTGAT